MENIDVSKLVSDAVAREIESQIDGLDIHEMTRTAAVEFVKKNTGPTLQAKINEQIEKQINDSIAAHIANGWFDYNSFGRAEKDKKTLHERVGEAVASIVNRGESGIDVRVQRFVDTVMVREFKTDIEAARETFRSTITAQLAKRFADELAKMLGVKAG